MAFCNAVVWDVGMSELKCFDLQMHHGMVKKSWL